MGVGVLRLGSRLASRRGYSAQDDIARASGWTGGGARRSTDSAAFGTARLFALLPFLRYHWSCCCYWIYS